MIHKPYCISSSAYESCTTLVLPIAKLLVNALSHDLINYYNLQNLITLFNFFVCQLNIIFIINKLLQYIAFHYIFYKMKAKLVSPVTFQLSAFLISLLRNTYSSQLKINLQILRKFESDESFIKIALISPQADDVW